jgi:hypothetical protein
MKATRLFKEGDCLTLASAPCCRYLEITDTRIGAFTNGTIVFKYQSHNKHYIRSVCSTGHSSSKTLVARELDNHDTAIAMGMLECRVVQPGEEIHFRIESNK